MFIVSHGCFGRIFCGVDGGGNHGAASLYALLSSGSDTNTMRRYVSTTLSHFLPSSCALRARFPHPRHSRATPATPYRQNPRTPLKVHVHNIHTRHHSTPSHACSRDNQTRQLMLQRRKKNGYHRFSFWFIAMPKNQWNNQAGLWRRERRARGDLDV